MVADAELGAVTELVAESAVPFVALAATVSPEPLLEKVINELGDAWLPEMVLPGVKVPAGPVGPAGP
jgi:hypothetical protein